MNPYYFRERTRRVLEVAGDAAGNLRHEYIGTEHILLALLQERQCVGTAALTHMDIDLDAMRATIEAIARVGNSVVPAGTPRPYTSRCKKVLELAMMAAREDNHSPVGTEHLLLGLLLEKKGIGAQVLLNVGVSPQGVAKAVGMVDTVDDPDSLP